MVTLAAAIGGIGGAALLAWEYGSRERDAGAGAGRTLRLARALPH